MVYIPRDRMPQIDAQYLPRLVAYALHKRHDVAFDAVHPDTLHAHQRVSHDKARAMHGKTLLKPCLVSADGYILDGNHRWWAHKHRDDKFMSIIRLDLPFDAALDFLFTFPHAYAYGDGNYHPEAA